MIVRCLMLLLVLGGSAFAFGHGGGTFPSQLNKNIITDYSATCDGVNDDTTAWNNFTAANAGNNVVLTISGTCCFLGMGTGIELAYGLAHLRVMGYGATITNSCNGTTGSGYKVGTAGGLTHQVITQDNSHSSLINTVSAGATSVTLQTSAETSRFTVGQWALLTGGDLQGAGYPPNPWSHDWVFVTGKDGTCTGTGTICFHDPLQNSYESTWPTFTSHGNIWIGGPATLYAISAGWGGVVEWRGVTFTDKTGGGVDQQFACEGLLCRFVDVTFTGTSNACGYPSLNQSFVYQNATGSGCLIEADKIVDQVLVERTTLDKILFQSASINQLLMTGSSIPTHIGGTPVLAIISNSSTAFLQLGATSFGVSKTYVSHGNTVTTTQDVGAEQDAIDGEFTMSGGVITLPNTQAVTATGSGIGGVVRVTVGTTAAYTTGKQTNFGGVNDITNGVYTITVVDGTHIDVTGTTFVSNVAGGAIGIVPGWATPGGSYNFIDGSNTKYPFTVTDLAPSGNSVHITTSLAGGFPASGIKVLAAPVTRIAN